MKLLKEIWNCIKEAILDWLEIEVEPKPNPKIKVCGHVTIYHVETGIIQESDLIEEIKE